MLAEADIIDRPGPTDILLPDSSRSLIPVTNEQFIDLQIGLYLEAMSKAPWHEYTYHQRYQGDELVGDEELLDYVELRYGESYSQFQQENREANAQIGGELLKNSKKAMPVAMIPAFLLTPSLVATATNGEAVNTLWII